MREDEAAELGWDDRISSEDEARKAADRVIDALMVYISARSEWAGYSVERERNARKDLREAILAIM